MLDAKFAYQLPGWLLNQHVMGTTLCGCNLFCLDHCSWLYCLPCGFYTT